MKYSENLADLLAALSKAQSKIRAATKDSINPDYKSGYASFDSIREASIGPLTDNGLSISQWVSKDEQGRITLITMLGHLSGQFILSEAPILLAKQDMQSLGSGISYQRRYSWSSAIGISSDEDDDGKKACDVSGKKESDHKKSHINNQKPQNTPVWINYKMSLFNSQLVDSNYKVLFGKFKDKTFGDIDPNDLWDYAEYILDATNKKKEKLKPQTIDFIEKVKGFCEKFDPPSFEEFK